MSSPANSLLWLVCVYHFLLERPQIVFDSLFVLLLRFFDRVGLLQDPTIALFLLLALSLFFFELLLL